jgi:hypothetical protein
MPPGTIALLSPGTVFLFSAMCDNSNTLSTLHGFVCRDATLIASGVDVHLLAQIHWLQMTREDAPQLL